MFENSPDVRKFARCSKIRPMFENSPDFGRTARNVPWRTVRNVRVSRRRPILRHSPFESFHFASEPIRIISFCVRAHSNHFILSQNQFESFHFASEPIRIISFCVRTHSNHFILRQNQFESFHFGQGSILWSAFWRFYKWRLYWKSMSSFMSSIKYKCFE
jgi:hypothetical protein